MFSGDDTVISLFFSVAVICGGSDGFGGSGVAVFCVKFVTFLVYAMLGYFCVGWI
jgi:hypothetical protein